MQIKVLVLLFVMLAAGCSQPVNKAREEAVQKQKTVAEAAIKEAQKINIDISKLASRRDPICEMPVSAKSLKDTALINGKLYGYCNTGCKEAHLKQLAEKKFSKK